MKPRFHSFGALVALLAISTFFAELVYASTCAPPTIVAGAEAAGNDGHSEHPCPDGGDVMPAENTERPEHSRSSVPFCPLGALGSGSCVPASLPGMSMQLAGLGLEHTVQFPPPDAARDLLLAAVLFHPPKA